MSAKQKTKLWQNPRFLLVIGLVVAIAVIAALAALNWFGGPGGAPGGGGGGNQTTTPPPGGGGNQTTTPPPGGGGGNQTATPPPGDVLYPTGDIKDGFNVIFLEDHVEVEGDRYKIVSRLATVFRSLVAYGGSSVTGNISYGTAYIKQGYYKIPVIGFASTSPTITQDFPGMKVRLTVDGGYVLYTPVSMAVYYRRYEFNISGTTVYVWVPAKSLPSRLTTEATQHVTIDPETCFYYVNGVPYRLVIDAPPRRVYKGVLRSWVLYADRYGVYVFQINP